MAPATIALLRAIADPDVLVYALPRPGGSWSTADVWLKEPASPGRTVTDKVADLERAGLVRLADPGARYYDRRHYSLTHAGEQALAALDAAEPVERGSSRSPSWIPRGSLSRGQVFDRLAAGLTKLLLAVLVVIAILGTAALPGVIGWFAADWADGSRIAGVAISYWVAGSLAWLLWNKDTEVLAISTVLAYVTAAPLIYLLTLATRALQVAVGAAPLGGPGDFLLRNLDGVLLGTALGVGLSLLGALKKGTEPLGPSGSRPDLNESFRLGLSFRIPLAFLLAGLMDLPATPPARIILGAAWGIVAALGAMIYTVVIDEEPVRAAWPQVAVTEMLFLLGGLIGAVDGLIDDHEVLEQALQLVPAAAAACGGTYLLGVLIARLVSAPDAPPTEP